MDDLNRYTIAKRKDGNYEIHHGYQPIIGKDVEVVHFTPIKEQDLTYVRRAKTQAEINEILSCYI